MKLAAQHFETILRQAGYVPQSVGTENIWKLSSIGNATPVQAAMEILQRKEQFTLCKCHVVIDCEKLLVQIQATAKKKFVKVGSFSTSISSDNTLKCLLELPAKKTNSNSDQRSIEPSPGTVIGWTVGIAQHSTSLALQITDAFLFGQTVPDWWSLILRTTITSMGSGLEQCWKMNNLFEVSIPLWMLPIDAQVIGRTKLLEPDLARSHSLRVPTALSVKRKKNKIFIDLATSETAIHSVSPLEILEARETSHTWLDFDKAIFDRLQPTLPQDAPTQNTPSLLARLAAAPYLLAESAKLPAIDIDQSSSYSLTALTGATILLKQQERAHDLIKYASDLLRGVRESYGELHSHAPLRHVVPETLGDFWSKVDTQKAIKSWQTAIDEKGPNPRIAYKIATLANDVADANLEFSTLLSLCSIERRSENLKKIAHRMIDLTAEWGEAPANTSAQLRRALEGLVQKTEFDHKIVISLAHLLRKEGNHLQALSLLESHAQEQNSGLSPTQLSQVHATIASIWHEDEKNTSLAATRYIAATTAPAAPTDDIFESAEQFFRTTKNSTQIRRIYDLRAKQALGQSSFEMLERAAKYMNEQEFHEDSVKAVMQLMSIGRFKQWYLDVVHDAFEIETLDWAAIANLMNSADYKQLPKDSLPMWKLMAARCAMKTTSAKSLAIELFTNPRVIPILSSLESNFVTNELISARNYAAFANFAGSRLAHASDQELQHILDVVIAENIGENDGLFDHAIAESANNKNDLSRSVRRLGNLINASNIRGAAAAIEAHKSTITDTTNLIRFLDQACLALAKSSNLAFEQLLEQTVHIRRELQAFNSEETMSLINLLLTKNFINLAQKQLSTGIESGECCVENEDIAHSLLADSPQLIARWHFIMFKKTANESQQLNHAKKSLHYWLQTDERPGDLIELGQKIGSIEVLSDATLTLLENLCRREQKIPQFVDLLTVQISKDSSPKRDLLYWAIRIINSHHMDPDKAVHLFNKWEYSQAPRLPQNLFSMGSLLLAARQLEDAQRCYSAVLNEPEILNEPVICLAAIDSLTRTKPERSQLATTFQTLISWSESANKQDLRNLFINKSIELRVASAEHLHRTFLNHFGDYTPKQLAEIAVQALVKAERTSQGVSKLLAEWQEVRAVADAPEKWRSIVACLVEDQFLSQLRRHARCELQYLHAKNLFENEKRRFDAIPHFEVICSENPMDSRAWIPLYSLYEESAAKQKLIVHLERIIPLIERDASTLEKTPFNIESLRNSLRRARKTISVLDQPYITTLASTNDSGPNSFEINDHAARLQRSWIDAIPLVKISAVTPNAAKGYAEDGSATAPPAIESSPDFSPLSSAFQGAAAGNLLPFSEPTNASKTSNEVLGTSSQSHLKVVESSANLSMPDWRKIVTSGNPPEGATKRIMTMAFASELEKHLAVQCTAMIAGETSAFEGWHWPVWRNIDALQYSTSISGRIPRDLGLKQYGSPLHKLIKMILPIILRINRRKFIIGSYLEQSGLPLNTQSTAVDFAHPALKRGLVRAFEPQINSIRAKLFDTPGLGSEVFFDLNQRAFHFDAKWQMNLPPSILSHRILEHLAHFQKGNMGVAFLNAESDIGPIIEDIRKIISATGMAKLRVAFGIEHRDIHEQLKKMNREQLVSLLAWHSGDILGDLKQLQFEMRIKALVHVLASTLDLVGLFEGISGKDLCAPGALSPDKIRSMDPLFASLLEIATKLNI